MQLTRNTRPPSKQNSNSITMKSTREREIGKAGRLSLRNPDGVAPRSPLGRSSKVPCHLRSPPPPGHPSSCAAGRARGWPTGYRRTERLRRQMLLRLRRYNASSAGTSSILIPVCPPQTCIAPSPQQRLLRHQHRCGDSITCLLHGTPQHRTWVANPTPHREPTWVQQGGCGTVIGPQHSPLR